MTQAMADQCVNNVMSTPISYLLVLEQTRHTVKSEENERTRKNNLKKMQMPRKYSTSPLHSNRIVTRFLTQITGKKAFFPDRHVHGIPLTSVFVCQPPKGRPGISDVSTLSGISGLSA